MEVVMVTEMGIEARTRAAMAETSGISWLIQLHHIFAIGQSPLALA